MLRSRLIKHQVYLCWYLFKAAFKLNTVHIELLNAYHEVRASPEHAHYQHSPNSNFFSDDECVTQGSYFNAGDQEIGLPWKMYNLN